MVLQKLIITISLIMAGSLASSVHAFDQSNPDNQGMTGWSSSAQPSTSPFATSSQLNLGEGWLDDKWSGQSSFHQTKGLQKGLTDTRQWSLDIKRRLLSATENTYLAMGLGWNDIAISEDESSSGMRFVAEGRVGIYGPAYLFGQAAYSPWMSNIGNQIDPFGKELELGLVVDPLPSMSFRAGYRSFWLDSMDSPAESSLRRQTDGFYIGGGLHW